MTTPQRLAERALEAGSRADACFALVDETAAVHLRWAENAITTNGAARSRRLTVVSLVGGSVGVASRSGPLDAAAVRDLVRAAEHAARVGPAGGVEPILGGASALDWPDPPADVDFAALSRLAARLSAAVEQARARSTVLCGYGEQQVCTTYLASSTGLRLRHAQLTGIVDVGAARRDGSASAWVGVGAPRVVDVDLVALTEQLELRLAWARRRAPLRPGRYEVLLPPACVADLMLRLYQAAGAREAVQGHAVFSRADGGTRLGERLTAAPLTLRSAPDEPGLECAPFLIARSEGRASVADNGLPLSPTAWIADGVLTALVQTRETARLNGQACTAEIDNLILEGKPGGATLEEMIARTDRAMLLTSLWYVRDVDPRRLLLTGVTRDGVYLIERGEVAAAVPDFRFNESPVKLLGRVAESGRTVPALPREWGDYFTRMAMPPLRVEGMDVAAVPV
jgi:predicted Zn-dependent protease